MRSCAMLVGGGGGGAWGEGGVTTYIILGRFNSEQFGSLYLVDINSSNVN